MLQMPLLHPLAQFNPTDVCTFLSEKTNATGSF